MWVRPPPRAPSEISLVVELVLPKHRAGVRFSHLALHDRIKRMRESGEFPLIPEPVPQEEIRASRLESSDLNIDEVEAYIRSTKFENKEGLEDVLSKQFNMGKKESYSDIQFGMTRIIKAIGFGKDRRIIEDKPLSGKEPEADSIISIETIDGRMYYLMIFKVTNRNQKFRYEYILEAK